MGLEKELRDGMTPTALGPFVLDPYREGYPDTTNIEASDTQHIRIFHDVEEPG
jgi:hypothetical protein